jgi:hypothetical protein
VASPGTVPGLALRVGLTKDCQPSAAPPRARRAARSVRAELGVRTRRCRHLEGTAADVDSAPPTPSTPGGLRYGSLADAEAELTASR